MSETVKYKGEITEIFRELRTGKEKIHALAKDLDIPVDDLLMFDDDYSYVDHPDYTMIIDRLFHTGNLKELDVIDDDYIHVEKIGKNKYLIETQFYNGGGSVSDMIEMKLGEMK